LLDTTRKYHRLNEYLFRIQEVVSIDRFPFLLITLKTINMRSRLSSTIVALPGGRRFLPIDTSAFIQTGVFRRIFQNSGHINKLPWRSLPAALAIGDNAPFTSG
jgi:hypothetical protein